jgi:cephalosporin-C deacetylase-like acetyl esterase
MYPRKPGVVDGKATEEGRGTALDVWAFEKAARSGYAVATFYVGDIQPDRPNVKEGLRAVLPLEGRADDTATIMGWAWGVSRAVDFLTVCPGIDPKRIAVVGHSRLGKTALVAAAFDERIALAIPHQAGCGGSGPSRHDDPKSESVQRITGSFPHWFCPNFAAFGESLDKLPFDQHCLVAMCAPRPVLFSNAAEDLWANPRGQFEMLKAATPVYELLGAEGLKAKEVPKIGELVNDRLGYFIRAGKHSMTFDDWKAFLAFADKWLK